MHLGMSGSFRVVHGSDETRPANSITSARQALGARPCRVPHVERRGRDVQRSAPLRLHEADRARRARPGSDDARRSGRSRSATRSTARCWRRPARARRPSLKAALLGPEASSPGLGNIYVCEALHRAHLSPKRQASTIALQSGAPTTVARTRSPTPSRRCSTTRSRPAARRCAITARPTATSAISSTRSASTTATARSARRRSCKGTIKRIVQGTRSTFFCPVCQK